MGVVPVALDLIGIFVFALSGALLGIRIQFDIVGVIVIGAVTGLGGGIMRDVLIGDIPPASFTDWRYLAVPVVAGLVAFRFHPKLARIERYVDWFDAMGLGLFCVLGTVKALVFGLDPIPAALMGVPPPSAVGPPGPARQPDPGGAARGRVRHPGPRGLARGRADLGSGGLPGVGADPRGGALHHAALPGHPLPLECASGPGPETRLASTSMPWPRRSAAISTPPR